MANCLKPPLCRTHTKTKLTKCVVLRHHDPYRHDRLFSYESYRTRSRIIFNRGRSWLKFTCSFATLPWIVLALDCTCLPIWLWLCRWTFVAAPLQCSSTTSHGNRMWRNTTSAVVKCAARQDANTQITKQFIMTFT